ncbi:MAG: Na/Pi cotransporter family protein [Gammaproteobacteria bacterium]|jgi:phosphate:Na+ symporter
MKILLISGQFAGGLGLFLLAVKLMTDGLKLAGGEALKDILGRWTRTPAHGLASGIMITALVQSSSAVTAATIGFVNAGLMNLYQALGVVYGANVGTTMTGWLVAAVGFQWKVETIALPLIGIGMLLQLTAAGTRRAAIGEALTGFGLFFIAVDVLKTAFESLSTTVDLQQWSRGGILEVFIFLGVGFILTILTQSSSAAIAITLTAATGGVLTLPSAAAMVIGANVGTTSTALFATIGATPNAKRVAAAHVAFNVGTGIVALIIMPAMLWFIAISNQLLGLSQVPAVSLALFHTLFNVLGIVIMLPLSSRLASFLERRFCTAEEDQSKPQYVDKTLTTTPGLSLNALVLEHLRIGSMARKSALDALTGDAHAINETLKSKSAINNLTQFCGEFIAKIQKGNLSADNVAVISGVLEVSRYYNEIAALATHSTSVHGLTTRIKDTALHEQIQVYLDNACKLIKQSDPLGEAYSIEQSKEIIQLIKNNYNQLKHELLAAGAEQQVQVGDTNRLLEQISNVRQIVRQIHKAARILYTLYQQTALSEVTVEKREETGKVEPEPAPTSDKTTAE